MLSLASAPASAWGAFATGDESAFAGPDIPEIPPVPVTKVTGSGRIPVKGKGYEPATISWPKAEKARVNLAGKSTLRHDAAATDPGWAGAGRLPIRVGVIDAARQGRAVDAVAVEILDRDVTGKAGVDGVLVKITGGLGASGAAGVELDYRGFATARGGDWASRLTLVRLPVCVLTTPDAPECRVRTVLPARNDSRRGTVSAEVTLSGTGTTPSVPTAKSASSLAGGEFLLAATADPAGPRGDYKATPPTGTGSWSGGTSGGGFTWSYPIRTPAGFGGPEPDLTLSYASQALDGRTAATNNQPNWVGDGWDLASSHIERRYKSCVDDMGAGGANTAKSWDQCWFSDNAVLSLNGRTTELVHDDATGAWTPLEDDGTKVERLKDVGTGNGDNDGEHWKVTTADGVRYYFGLNRLPGWTGGKPETGSTYTVPVFGNNDGEPCRQDGNYAASFCNQAWRWNLDYVVDPRNNAMAYYYTQEKNFYGRNVDPATGKGTPTQYVRGGWLDRVEYGLRADDVFAPAPMQVSFGVVERCTASGAITCAPGELKIDPDPSKDTTKYWPDVPFDQNCDAGKDCKGIAAPTFWSRKRLVDITTKVRTGGVARDVDSWSFTQTFKPTGDSARDFPLWLESITRSGKAGGAAPISLPPVTFGGIQLDNRVDGLNDGAAPFTRWRVNSVASETGGTTAVVYSEKDCTKDTLPAVDANGKRCYPTFWQKPVDTQPTLDWFHKYVAVQVREEDGTGGAPAKVTDYEFVGTPAWVKSTDEFSKPENRTFSEYRGYQTVKSRTGAGADRRTLAEATYFRGLDGIEVKDSENNPVVDHAAFQGMARESRTYDFDGGALISSSVFVPWHSGATATHARGGLPDLVAVHKGVEKAYTRTPLADGKMRRTVESTTFDTHGMRLRVDESGDSAVTGDERCTRLEYARNPGANLLSLVSRTETVAVGCDVVAERPKNVVSDVRTGYDGGTPGAAPSQGLVTSSERIKADGSGYEVVTTAAHDVYGRTVSIEDAFGRATRTAFTPATGESPIRSQVTNPKNFVTVTEFDARRGIPVAVIDPNLKRIDNDYDALGRVVAVWGPGWSKADHPNHPNSKFAYTVANDAATVVTSQTLMHNSEYKTSYEIFDSLLRTRQTQTPTFGGRLIGETFYDSRGWTPRVFKPYYATGAPQAQLVTGDPLAVPDAAWSEFDGQGRVTAAVAKYLGVEKSRTTTIFEGDRTTVLPPAGGIAQTTIVDVRGKTTELRQYTSADRSTWQSVHYEYADRGLLTRVTDAGGSSWRNEYDVLGRTIKVTDPDKGVSTMTYDAADRVVTTTDARGVVLTNDYDELGRRTAVRNGATPLESWVFDTVAKGQQTSATRTEAGRSFTTAVTGYTDRYQPSGKTVVIPAEEGKLSGTYTWKFYYNERNGVTEMVDLPAAGGLPAETVRTTYDDVTGLPVGTAGLVPYVQNTLYDNYGMPTRLDMSLLGKRVYQSYGYDPHDHKLLSSTVTRDVAPVQITDTRYRYDPAGNVTRVSEDQGAAAGSVRTDTQCFAYDALRRMTAAWTATDACAAAASTGPSGTVGGPDAYWTSFTFDAVGSRRTETIHGLGGSADALRTYNNSGHRLDSVTTTGTSAPTTDTYGYDAGGNTTTRGLANGVQTLTWGVDGRLSSTVGGGDATYAYAADGSRLLRRAGDNVTLSLGETELTWTKSDDKVLGTRYYNHAGRTVAERVAKASGGVKIAFLAADPHGTATTSIDGATSQVTRRRTTPFGAPRGVQPQQGTGADQWPDDKGFLGAPMDPFGLTHVGAREYDPSIGRFVSADPVMVLTDGQQLHGYAYSNNNPMTYDDPSGLCASEACFFGNHPVGNPPAEPTIDATLIDDENQKACSRNDCSGTRRNSSGSRPNTSGNKSRSDRRARGEALWSQRQRVTEWFYSPDESRNGDKSTTTGMNPAEKELCFRDMVACGEYMEISSWAKRQTAKEYGDPNSLSTSEGGEQANAFRHTIWQGALTRALGEKRAAEFADAHEAFGTSREVADSKADLFNNEFGRAASSRAWTATYERVSRHPSMGLGFDGYFKQALIGEARAYVKSDAFARPKDFK
ncbi:RHS repeat domain-containing protein [Embleya sp. NPDC056575]|uniref:RHS repeat domain-containing protein n=1 Tax=unclassified Embleya TaxID=2699296 RepID=UPI0036B6DD88